MEGVRGRWDFLCWFTNGLLTFTHDARVQCRAFVRVNCSIIVNAGGCSQFRVERKHCDSDISVSLPLVSQRQPSSIIRFSHEFIFASSLPFLPSRDRIKT